MSNLNLNKFVILWSLPAGGKTTYAKSLKNAKVIDIDRILKYKPSYISTYDYIAQEATPSKYKKDYIVVLDGLITTNEIAKNIMQSLLKLTPEANFEIVFWEKDVDACLWNDIGRRKLDSKIPINNLPFEEPSSELSTQFNVNLIRKQVVRKSKSKVWINSVINQSDDTLESDSWSLGGSWRNCWGDSGRIDPSTPPASFKRFDDLLEEICPKITFLQYKKLYNKVVSVKETHEGDYYGSSSTYAQYSCDLNKLYEILTEMRVIEEIKSYGP